MNVLLWCFALASFAAGSFFGLFGLLEKDNLSFALSFCFFVICGCFAYYVDLLEDSSSQGRL